MSKRRAPQPPHLAAMTTGPMALLQQARHLGSQGRFKEAAERCRQFLKSQPGNPEAHHLLGMALMELGQFETGVASLRAALGLQPGHGGIHNHLGVALCRMGRVREGLPHCQQAVSLAPDMAAYHYNLGQALIYADASQEAEGAFRQAVALQPDFVAAWYGLATLLFHLARPLEAKAAFEQTLALDPRHSLAHAGIAGIWRVLGHPRQAEQAYQASLTLQPNAPEVLNNHGALLDSLGRKAEARTCFLQAVQLNPGLADAWMNLASLHDQAGDILLAEQAYVRAVELLPMAAKPLAGLISMRRKLCQWDGLANLTEKLRQRVLDPAHPEQASLSPFLALNLAFTPAENQIIARQWSTAIQQRVRHWPPLPPASPLEPGPLRVGFLSSDFREHPITHLLAGVLEHLGRHLIVAGYAMGVPDDSPQRQRVASACHLFRDLTGVAAWEAARTIRADGIQILVDLNGYTAHAQPEILALRPAPVQVNYLGFPGTMGAAFMDWILVDAVVVPPEEAGHFDEELCYLPDTYQPNDPVTLISSAPSRQDCGLPATALVCCSFCMNYKIDPQVMDAWAAILRQVPDSVLWLYQTDQPAAINLRREAEQRGIAAERLIFAERLPRSQHLARHQVADLFLDTLTYGGHTTVSDALRTGLPVVTLAGDTFARRVGASLLQAVGLPELIATDQAAYIQLAVDLACNRSRLQALRAKLRASLSNCPLFDPQTFSHHLAAALQQMGSGLTVRPVCPILEPQKG